MKSLNEILNESSGDELLGRMMAEYKVFISTLKSLGFEKAPIGSSTYKPGPNRGKVEELWGIPMRAGKWADIFFAVMYDDRLPWRLIDRDGTESYAKLNDVNKALMKRIRTIKEEQSDEETDAIYEQVEVDATLVKALKKRGFVEAPVNKFAGHFFGIKNITKGKIQHIYGVSTRPRVWINLFFMVLDDETHPYAIVYRGADSQIFSDYNAALKALDKTKAEFDREDFYSESTEDEEVDPTGEALSELEDICEMADELYETLSDLDEIDSETRESITAIYLALDDLYETVDKKYEVTVDADEYEEVNEEVDMTRFKQLASTGLVSREELPKLVLAMRALDADKPLSMSQKDLINSTFQSLIAIVTGDTSVLSKVKSSIANN
jgi:hypothetical protein